ncbi:hypothetical protein Tsubulata_008107, partial [Turnera subulata]
MGKQKQQTISRFFSPKPKPIISPTTHPPAPPPPPPSSSTTPPPPPPASSSSSPKVTATVSYSPAKRKLLNAHLTTTNSTKKPKPLPSPSPSPSLHQKFLDRLLEPSPSPSSSSLPHQNPPPPAKYTPLERQVVDLKAAHPDVLLMVEVGYRYRFFGHDAEVASRVLGIYAHVDHNFLTASIPTFRLNVHVRRLVGQGYKVGVVRQTETAAIKAHGDNKAGPFCRGLSALYTKATLEAARDLGGATEEGEGCGGESNYLCCVVEKSVGVEEEALIGVVAVEVSTGDVVFGEFRDGFMRSGLEAALLSLAPAELLLGDPLSRPTEKLLLAYAGPSSNVRVERSTGNCFMDGGALAEVISLYENMGEDNVPDNNNQAAIEGVMKMPDSAVQALALTIRHLKLFGLERILCLGASFRPLSSNKEMKLSANTLQQLEVLRNNSDGSESGSLLHIMNHTLTIYGSRMLRQWVTHPLCDRNMISARLDAVSEIAESMGSYKASKHRGIGRIFHRTATASERLQVEEPCNDHRKQTQIVHSVLLRKLILTAVSPSLIANVAQLLSMISKEAAEQGDLLNLIIVSDGQFPEVARVRKAVQLAKEDLDSLISVYRKELGMRKLEFLTVSGITHLIELPVDIKVPPNWTKVNSTKKTIRYHPPEVLTGLDRLSLATEELTIVCQAAWDGFLRGFAKYYAEIQAAVQALAALDCLHSLSILSKNKNYVRPVFVDDEESVQIRICDGRHPVLETVLLENFVPNDTDLHADREYCQIVTGPNMGGKSCYIRQVALITLMAQVGSFVPANSAKLHVLDGIFTRMGASDSIQHGRSTFLEELNEASDILLKCTQHSLVIIDELGRGTSTHDGAAIAYATLHHLLDQKRCLALFVTHYPKIAEIKTEFPGSVGAYHVSYLTQEKILGSMEPGFDDDVTYLYKLVAGISEKSFGFKVAHLAQLPPSCISRATIMAARLEAILSNRLGEKQQLKTLEGDQQSDSSDDFGGIQCPEGLSKSYRIFFSNLDSAILDSDPMRSFQFLENARSVAKELLP